MNNYNEVMEQVELTEEMQKRIIGRVADNYFEAKKKDQRKQLQVWVSTLTTLAAAAALIAFIYPRTTSPVNPDPGQEVDIDVGGETGGEDHSSGGFVYRVFKNLDEMNAHYFYEIEELTGLPFSIRTERYIGYGRYPQILYYGEVRDDVIYYRTYLEPGDQSGFEYPYDLNTTIEVNGTTVGIKGMGDRIQVVYWPDADEFFWHSLYYKKGFTEEEVHSIIEKNR